MVPEAGLRECEGQGEREGERGQEGRVEGGECFIFLLLGVGMLERHEKVCEARLGLLFDIADAAEKSLHPLLLPCQFTLPLVEISKPFRLRFPLRRPHLSL